MEYRALPHGAPTKRFSTLGLGLGGIQQAPAAEIRQVIETAIAHGINFFDLCAGAAKTYAPFGQAIRGRREQVFFQLHLGAVYNESGEYGWSRDLSEIQRTFAWELETLGTDYADFGFLHCVDDLADIDALEKNGILEFAQSMRRAGHLRHEALFCRQAPLQAESPFHQALTRFQCLQYALDRPGDALAASHYGKLSVNASACISCGHCAARCPFGVDQPSRMEEIARYFA